MDTQIRRDGSGFLRSKSMSGKLYKKPYQKFYSMKYSTSGDSKILKKKWVPAKFLGEKVNYKSVVKSAKPNSNMPSFVRGNAEDVKITSYKLLKKYDEKNKM